MLLAHMMSSVVHINPLFLGLPFPLSRLQGFHKFIDEMLPHESPVHYGLHPNAEIEFLTVTSDNLFHTLLELQSPDAVTGEGASQTLEEKVGAAAASFSSFSNVFSNHSPIGQVKTILDEVLEKLPEEYNMSDITSKTAERSPYTLACFQECERMNQLVSEMRRSLKELDLGLKVCRCVGGFGGGPFPFPQHSQ